MATKTHIASDETLARIADALEARNQSDDLVWDEAAGEYTASSIAAMLASKRDGLVYGTRVPDWATTQTPGGEKTRANAGLVCTPSTNTTAGRDDYAGRLVGRWWRVNARVDERGVPHVMAFDGDGNFRTDGTNGDVMVLKAVKWWAWVATSDGYHELLLSDSAASGLSPQPGATLPDGSLRPYILQAAYPASVGPDGKAASLPGRQPITRTISQNTCVDLARAKGDGWSMLSWADMWEYETQFLLRYASKSSESVFTGCTGYTTTAKTQLAESGVYRVVLAKASADALVPGSAVMVGSSTADAAPDRGAASAYDLVEWARVTSIEAIDDATSAVNLDLPAAIDVPLGCWVQTAPWPTGSCDAILGGDGSPSSPKGFKEPFRLAGVELMVGVYEVVCDVTLNALGREGGEMAVEAWLCPSSSALSKTSTDGYEHVADLPVQASEGWVYQADVSFPGGMPLGAGTGSSTSTGTGDGHYQNVAVSKGLREFLAFGYLGSWSGGGLLAVVSDSGLARTGWIIGSRLSAIGLRG